MSLPPGFLDDLRARLSLGDVVGRKVMWDSRKSNQAKGDLWAPCPFHQEKTASFHVDDRKGYYYCFGCHAKGDAISFVRETENVGFMEAVEILAGEVGMEMPARDHKAQEKADARTRLTEVMEQAVQFFRLQLASGAGAAARDYLAGRGLASEALARWGIGFAPASWEGLRNALTAKGATVEDLLACGLVKPSDKGRAPYDTFRNRIMFPIRDPRGRAIAFGGRAMDPEDNAKYLNSPETVLFDKGRSLYNHGPAREAAGKGAPLVVGEGYMDVIALAEAGIPAAVAPLGTAITEEQLRLLWRIADEPILALDGDRAGLRAAMRVIDIALPLLEPGKSLRFCLLPEGQDPDDLIRAQGAAAMKALLDRAEPMVNLLWRREVEVGPLDSPERKAALDQRLRRAVSQIADQTVRRHYGDAIFAMRRALFAPPPVRRRGLGEAKPSWRSAAPATRASDLAGQAGKDTARLREQVVLASLLMHPTLIEGFGPDLESTEFTDQMHASLAHQLLLNADLTDPDAVRTRIAAEIGEAPLEKLFASRHVRLAPPLRHPDDIDLARSCILDGLARLAAERGAEREVDEAMQAITGDDTDDRLDWRLSQAAAALQRATQAPDGDESEYEIAENGARVDRDERDTFEKLLQGIGFSKDGASH